MQVLFVHGMGRTPISAIPTLWRLRKQGHSVDVLAYFTATESFEQIVERVCQQITQLAEKGEYVLIGHSLGGIMLRSALQKLGNKVRQPQHLFLLGSPVSSPRLAKKSQHELGFQMFTGDCGQLLASKERLQQISMPDIAITSIVGTRDFPLTKKYFLDDANDGVVSVAECAHPEINDVIEVPVIHTFLPSSQKVFHIIQNKISEIHKQLLTRSQ